MDALKRQARHDADAESAFDHRNRRQIIHNAAGRPHCDPVFRQKRLHVRVRRVALNDKRLRAHLFGHNHARRFRFKPARRDAHQPVAIQRTHRQIARGLRRQKAQIHHARLDPLDHIVICALIDFDFHTGVFHAVFCHELRQPRHAHAVERANAHLAALHAFQFADRLRQRLVGGKHLPDHRIERFAAAGQRHAALAANEERKAAGLFHRADGVADGAGRQMQNLRGARKTALLSDGMKNAIFQQRHCCSSCQNGMKAMVVALFHCNT